MLGLLLLLYGYRRWRDNAPPARTIFLAQCLSIPLLLIAFQIHFAALALLPLIPYALWTARDRIIRSAFLVALALSVAVCLPYFLGLARTLESDPARISDALARSAAGGLVLSPDSIEALVLLASGTGLETWMAPAQGAQLAAGYPPLAVLPLLLLLPLIIGIRAAIRRSRQCGLLLLIWAFLPGALLLIEWTPVYIHYFIPSIPAMMLLIALGVDDIMAHLARMRVGQALVLLIGLGIFALQFLSWQAALNFVESTQVPYPGFTAPLGKLLPLRDRLARADDVVVVAHGMAWNLHHEVAVWDTLLWDDVACVRTIVEDGYAVFPQGAFTVLISPEADADPIGNLYRADSGAIYPLREGGGNYVVYEWQEAPLWTGTAIHGIATQQFDNGVRLTGYGWDGEQIVLEWRLPAQQVGADFQYSAQLFDAAGERLAQLDRTFWHGRHWCAGDRLLTWGPLTSDSAGESIKVAMYRLGSG